MIEVLIQNSRSSHRRSASGFKGVTRNGTNWEALISVPQNNGIKKIYIGTYPTIEQAVEARKDFIVNLL